MKNKSLLNHSLSSSSLADFARSKSTLLKTSLTGNDSYNTNNSKNNLPTILNMKDFNKFGGLSLSKYIIYKNQA